VFKAFHFEKVGGEKDNPKKIFYEFFKLFINKQKQKVFFSAKLFSSEL
jgi:hypothetical protein